MSEIGKIYDLLNNKDYKLAFILGESIGINDLELMNKIWETYHDSIKPDKNILKLGDYEVFNGMRYCLFEGREWVWSVYCDVPSIRSTFEVCITETFYDGDYDHTYNTAKIRTFNSFIKHLLL